ncbi:hypothetical protein [Candidatus Leptofilum sp.]|uniref:hypothetical protein n=1 Tax=Candidatus Leptofilum sp. TaxID=3241576 RepID=UPI003B5B65CC
MKRSLSIFTISMLWLALAACTQTVHIIPTATTVANTPLPTPTLASVVTETTMSATATATSDPAPTAVSAQPTTTPDSNSLRELVQTKLPTYAFEGLDVLMLNVPQGERPLWVVYSQGFRNYDYDPVPSHFVALYTWQDDSWYELAYQELNNESSTDQGIGSFGPDYLFEQSVIQVDLAPDNLWLAVDGGIGAHGGTFQLLRFDGANFLIEQEAGNASPGVSTFEDLNDDGNLELITLRHDYYVFCYACGVRYLGFGVYSWDDAAQQLTEHTLQPLPADLQDHPAYQPNNRAVELANAGLWLDALTQIEEAERLAAETAVPTQTPTLQWNASIIRLYEQAYRDELEWTPYPLLTNIFYGDYAAALDIMRGTPNEQIFSSTSPLIQGTVAEFNEQWLAEYVLQQTNAAINVQPDLAAAYYFRAWAATFHNPTNPQIEADLQQAAALNPNEPLFSQVALPAANRIQFGPGETSATITGQLDTQGVDIHVLTALAGQQMVVTLTVPDEQTRVSVQDGAGNYLYGQVASTLWQGELAESGDYVIRVIGGETAVNYTLQVIIPQRITFAPGATSAIIEGNVAAYEADDYILTAQAGQTMRVAITSPNANVILTIVGADGIPLVNGNMSGATNWQGELPATQDYTIRAIGTEEPNTYTLTVSIE